MKKAMLQEYFKQYIKVSEKRERTDKSVGNYISGIKTINRLLEERNCQIVNLFDVNSFAELDKIKTFLSSNEEFRKMDSKGHGMYSVAFKHFCSFASENSSFFADSMEKMDIPTAIPQRIITASSGWRRNQILIAQAVEGARHKCEHDSGHQTFTAKSTGKAYMEGHHLIPLKYQSEFQYGIDIYANIVCLCPICHRLLHFGCDTERIYTAEKLFDKRKERLIRSGIDISKGDFLRLVVQQG